MKTLFIALLAFSMVTKAQTYNVNYEYDNAGNRVKRTVLCVGCLARKETPEVIDTVKTVITEEKSILLYPNPVKDFLNVALKGDWKLEQVQLQIFDMSGRSVLKMNQINKTQEVSFTDIPIGAYVLTITIENKKHSYTVMRE